MLVCLYCQVLNMQDKLEYCTICIVQEGGPDDDPEAEDEAALEDLEVEEESAVEDAPDASIFPESTIWRLVESELQVICCYCCAITLLLLCNCLICCLTACCLLFSRLCCCDPGRGPCWS